MLTEAGGSKKRKGEFVSQYDKKHLQHVFTVAACSKQMPRPLCLECSQIYQTTQWSLSNLLVIFIRSTAIFKASHWIIFKDYSAR